MLLVGVCFHHQSHKGPVSLTYNEWQSSKRQASPAPLTCPALLHCHTPLTALPSHQGASAAGVSHQTSLPFSFTFPTPLIFRLPCPSPQGDANDGAAHQHPPPPFLHLPHSADCLLVLSPRVKGLPLLVLRKRPPPLPFHLQRTSPLFLHLSTPLTAPSTCGPFPSFTRAQARGSFFLA